MKSTSSRHGSLSSQQYQHHRQHQLQPSQPLPLQQQQQQYYHHQKISKSKRSRSMDDFSTQMSFEQSSSSSSKFQKNNTKNATEFYFQQQSSPQGNRPNFQYNQTGSGGINNNALIRNSNLTKQKKQMRHSVDNLLEIDTSYFNEHHQVKF